MQYFDQSDGAPERIGKIVGDIFSGLIYLSIFGVMLLWFFNI